MSENDVEAVKASILKRLEGEEMDGLSKEDLADAMSHPKAAEVVAELMPFEASSVQQGDPARDFELRVERSGRESVEHRLGLGQVQERLGVVGEVVSEGDEGVVHHAPRSLSSVALDRSGIAQEEHVAVRNLSAGERQALGEVASLATAPPTPFVQLTEAHRPKAESVEEGVDVRVAGLVLARRQEVHLATNRLHGRGQQ